jgi:hypothetical protein
MQGRDNDYGERDLVDRIVMLLRAMAYWHVPALRLQMTWRW